MDNVNDYFSIYVSRVSTWAQESHMHKGFAVESSNTQITHSTEQNQVRRAIICKAPRTMSDTSLGQTVTLYCWFISSHTWSERMTRASLNYSNKGQVNWVGGRQGSRSWKRKHGPYKFRHPKLKWYLTVSLFHWGHPLISLCLSFFIEGERFILNVWAPFQFLINNHTLSSVYILLTTWEKRFTQL